MISFGETQIKNAMKSTVIHLRTLLIFGVPFLLLSFLVWLMQSPFIEQGNSVGLAITLDLVLTVPLVYFLLIRKTTIPKTTVLPVLGLGILLGTFLLPSDQQAYLNGFKTWILPFVELFAIGYVIVKVRLGIRQYKTAKASAPDFFSAVKTASADILPRKLVHPFATEISVLYYGLFHWKKHRFQAGDYAYHRKSGTPALLGAFVFLILMETFIAHILLARWNETVAWVLTILSAYTALQLFGYVRSLGKRPTVIGMDALKLRYGILAETEIPLGMIEKVELSRERIENFDNGRKISPFGEMENHNILLHLKEKQMLIGLFGTRREFKTLAIHLDEPEAFLKELNEKLSDN